MKKKRNDKYGLAKVLAAIGVIALLGSAAAAASAWLKGLSRRMPVPRGDGKKVKRGFTLAEVLAVALIIIILTSVSFVGVIRYQRSMKLMEMDGIAKQVFIAAQNHLTLAKSQGYLGKLDGTPEKDAEGNTVDGIYYFIVGSGTGTYSDPDAASDTLLSLMLPYASVDETVRKEGSYIIRYQNQQDVAQVLDVFYVDKGGRFGHTYGTDDYYPLMDPTGNENPKYWGTANKNNRLDYGGSIIGWYGGERGTAGSGPAETPPPVTKLVSPTLNLHNDEEKLWAELLDPNVSVSGLQWNLVITGDSSGKKSTVKLVKTLSPDVKYNQYTFTLDDITSTTNHFSALFGELIPGENITLQATVDATGEYLTVVSSNVCHGNSLFGDNSFTEKAIPATSDKYYYGTASIENFRHLENLDAEISGLNITALNGKLTRPSTDPANPPVSVSFTEVRLEKNLDWVNSWFFKNKKKITYAAKKTEDSASTAGTGDSGCYLPVTPEYSGLIFDGNNKSIKRLIVNTDGMAGVFGTYKGGKIQNLTIQNPSIVSSTNAAGALAGKTEGTTVNNVVARNEDGSKSFTLSAMRAPEGSGQSFGGLPVLWARGLLGLTQRDPGDTGSETTKTYTLQIKGTTAAGGLIGSMEGGEVKFSAAALFVSSTGSDGAAGGLVGMVSETATIQGSYASGHTEEASYTKTPMNVQANGTAGGLVGICNGTLNVECSYSTCSVKGTTTAGGFIGSLTGGTATVDTCYCTGLVQGITRDAFCNGNPTLLGVNRYIKQTETVKNGDVETTTYILSEINDGLTGIVAEDWANQVDFIRQGDEDHPRGAADSYDGYLKVKYGASYLFPTVAQLYEMAAKDNTGSSTNKSHVSSSTPDGLNSSAISKKHIGDWYVPIPVPMNYEWINGDILTLKINFARYSDLNQNQGPAILMVAVTGETSGQTRFFQLTRKSGSNEEYEFAGEKPIGYLDKTTKNGSEVSFINWNTGLSSDNWTITNKDETVTLVFDDITMADGNSTFKKLMCSMTGYQAARNFIPGENLTVMVNTLPMETLQDLAAMETEWKELDAEAKAKTKSNSLFGYNAAYNPVAKVVQKNDSGTVTGSVIQGKAEITSIRHLENLNGTDSHYGKGLDSYHTGGAAAGDTLEAYQTKNLSWISINGVSGFTTTTTNKEDCIGNSDYPYKPVDTAYKLQYKGEYTESTGAETVKKAYSITGISVTAENAGIFGTLDSDDSITGLELVDIAANATDSGSAGALAGTSSGTVTGVLVRSNANAAITAKAGGAAGGLIGHMTGGKVVECAAAVTVKCTDPTNMTMLTGYAGGLIGKADNSASAPQVLNSYSGGRTTSQNPGWYYTVNSGGRTYTYNIQGGTAGGLIGSASGVTVENTYSTCSVKGNTQSGGLIGSAVNGSVSNSYSVSLVYELEGAFVGQANSTAFTACAYLDVGSYYQPVSGTTSAVSGTTSAVSGITAMDEDVATFNTWAPQTGTAEYTCYDSSLHQIYGGTDTQNGKYVFKTISQLNASAAGYDWITTHYGDWAALETLVPNTKG